MASFSRTGVGWAARVVPPHRTTIRITSPGRMTIRMPSLSRTKARWSLSEGPAVMTWHGRLRSAMIGRPTSRS